MAFIQWSGSYSVFNSEMDSQHAQLVDMINRLHTAMAAGKAADVVENILKELAQYTVSHFTAEERLMSALRFPNFKQHKALHDEMITLVKKSLLEVTTKQTTVSLKLLTFLREWLIEHIAGEDKKYGELCRLKKVA